MIISANQGGNLEPQIENPCKILISLLLGTREQKVFWRELTDEKKILISIGRDTRAEKVSWRELTDPKKTTNIAIGRDTRAVLVAYSSIRPELSADPTIKL